MTPGAGPGSSGSFLSSCGLLPVGLGFGVDLDVLTVGSVVGLSRGGLGPPISELRMGVGTDTLSDATTTAVRQIATKSAQRDKRSREGDDLRVSYVITPSIDDKAITMIHGNGPLFSLVA